jgi:hypothetical protein
MRITMMLFRLCLKSSLSKKGHFHPVLQVFPLQAIPRNEALELFVPGKLLTFAVWKKSA